MYNRKATDERYRKAHREVCNSRTKAWKKAHPVKLKRSTKLYREENKKEIVKRSKKYRDKTVKKRKRYNAKYYKEHLEDYRRRLRTWRKDNPERARIQTHSRRAREYQTGGSYTETQWLNLCNKYRNKCLSCHKVKKLTPDHVIPVSKGGTSSIVNIQPLCQPCNSRKATKTIDYRKQTKPCS